MIALVQEHGNESFAKIFLNWWIKHVYCKRREMIRIENEEPWGNDWSYCCVT